MKKYKESDKLRIEKIRIISYIMMSLIFFLSFVYVLFFIKVNLYDLMKNENILMENRRKQNPLPESNDKSQNVLNDVREVGEFINSKDDFYEIKTKRNIFN